MTIVQQVNGDNMNAANLEFMQLLDRANKHYVEFVFAIERAKLNRDHAEIHEELLKKADREYRLHCRYCRLFGWRSGHKESVAIAEIFLRHPDKSFT